LKNTLRENVQEEESKRIENDVRTKVIEALVERNPVELPKTLVQEQKQMLQEDVKKRLSDQGFNDEQIEEYLGKWGTDVETSARFMVHSSFLVDQLATDHNLHWTEDDFNARMDEMAKSSGLEVEKLKEFYGQPKMKSRLCFRITEDKVVDFLLSKATITEIEARESNADD
jgi:trigger factor